MKALKTIRVEDLLNSVETFRREDAVFAKGHPLTLETPIMICDIDDETIVEHAAPRGHLKNHPEFSYLIDALSVRDVILNLSLQGPDNSLRTKLRALNFYLENDAFLDLSLLWNGSILV